MPTLLVTGGLGFVMSHVARQWLDAEPGNTLILLDPSPFDVAAARWFEGRGERIHHVQALTTDAAALNALPDHITHVVHGAAVTSMNRLAEGGAGLSGMLPALKGNMDGTVDLLVWAQARKGIQRFINVSSGSVYANHGPAVISEEGPVDPDGFYGVTKYLGEMVTTQTAQQFGLSAVSVRLSGVYGPMDRETPHRAVRCVPMRILQAALEGRVLSVDAPDAVGDFIHAGCVARAILGLLVHPGPTQPVYNIAYGQTVTHRQLIAHVQALVSGFEWEEAASEEADLVGDPNLTTARWGAYDITRLHKETGWSPIPIEESLADYLAWLRQ